MTTAPSVAAILGHVPGLGATLIAGSAGTARRVASVRILSAGQAVDPSSFAGALVVAGSEMLTADGVDLVARLHGADVAGLVTVGDRDLPAAVLGRAEELSLPVVVVAPGLEAGATAVELLNAVVALQREGSHALEERYAAITLEELVSGDRSRAADAVERAGHLGWDLHRPRAVLLASIDPPVEAGVAARTIGTLAAAARATLGEDAIVWSRATSVAVLLADDPGDHGQRRRLAEALRVELDERVTHVTLSIGVGRSVTDPHELATSFVDANRAVDVGRWAKGRHVTELYDELGLERLFASVPEQDLHDFVLHAIGPLLDHDRRHRTALVETLSTWLQTRNVAEGARQVFVHYNTFKNRLERIESIAGPMFDDPARLLECEVAIHVARHYDGPWATGS